MVGVTRCGFLREMSPDVGSKLVVFKLNGEVMSWLREDSAS